MEQVEKEVKGVEIMSDPYLEHGRLFTHTGLKLGEILWYLERADQEMQRKTHIYEPSDSGIGRRIVWTDFGEEVGKDEIYWWVYRKEKDVDGLRERVRGTLEHTVQPLKVGSAALEPSGIQTYADLVEMLAEFLEEHKSEINSLLEFVHWLYERDPLAPAMLFTYRVWGSTRRSDRYLELEATSRESESPVPIIGPGRNSGDSL